MDRAIHVRLGLNQTRGDERDHQLVALAEMIAARIATAALPSMARSTAGIVSPKSSLVEHAEECNLERTKSLLLGTRSLLSGQKSPVHVLKKFLKISLQHKGLLVCAPS